MFYLVEILLLLAPLGLLLLWWRLQPQRVAADRRLAPAALVGLVLALGAAIWFGFDRRQEPGGTYVPAALGPDGEVQPAHTDPPR
jgi:hypothetical protein